MKGIASDFDGTLYFGDIEGGYKKEDLMRIKEFQDKGHCFGICTGRPLVGIEDNLKGKLMTQSGQENSFPVRMNCDTIKMANVGEVSKLGTLFVMVPDKVTTIEVDMVISVPLSSDSDVQTVPVKLKLTSADNFERGKEYSYTIEMRSLEEIYIKASVEEWNNGDEGSDEDQKIIVDGIESEEGGLTIE